MSVSGGTSVTDGPAPTRTPGRARVWLLVIGIALAALNLRTAVTSVGPLLDEIRRALGMSGSVAGVLTTLPVLCFAGIGSAGPMLAHRFGERRVVAGALACLTAGLLARAVVGSVWLFLVFSALALVGGALGNVLIPPIIKRAFPSRVGVMTAMYTTAMALGTTLAAGITVPVADAAGSWRVGLGAWFLLAAVAFAPWLGLLRREPAAGDGHRTVTMRSLLRTRLAWLMAGYFGSQSLQAYVAFGWVAQILIDAGISRQTAGAMLALLTALSVPMSLVLPALAARMRNQFPLAALMSIIYVCGWTGLLIAPAAGAWVWSVLLGLGAGAFPLALTLIALRSQHGATTAALSAFTQCFGYVLAGAGPLLFGVLHDLTGGWTVPMLPVFAMLAVQLGCGWFVTQRRHIEDELAG